MIYLANINDFTDEFYSLHYANLPKYKYDELSHVLNLKSKKQSILAWTLLSKILRKNFNISEYEIILNKHKKPYLINQNLYFNLSHSGDFVICAVCENEIGIDIQKITTFNSSLVKRVFSNGENLILSRTNDRDLIFTKIWTLKESYIKFTSKGLDDELNLVDFSEYINNDKFEFRGHKMFSMITEKFVLSVCSQKYNWEIKEVDEKSQLFNI